MSNLAILHSLVNALALNAVYKTVCVGVHNFTFVTVVTYTRGEIRISRLSICRVYTTYTYVNRLVELHLEFAQFDGD